MAVLSQTVMPESALKVARNIDLGWASERHNYMLRNGLTLESRLETTKRAVLRLGFTTPEATVRVFAESPSRCTARAPCTHFGSDNHLQRIKQRVKMDITSPHSSTKYASLETLRLLGDALLSATADACTKTFQHSSLRTCQAI